MTILAAPIPPPPAVQAPATIIAVAGQSWFRNPSDEPPTPRTRWRAWTAASVPLTIEETGRGTFTAWLGARTPVVMVGAFPTMAAAAEALAARAQGAKK